MTDSITFILPTRNRTDYVGRAIDSCLAVESSGLSVRVMVIDASSTSDCIDMLRERYRQQPAVEVLAQPPDAKGFMGACFFAVGRLETRFATFMYDDDVLSPYIASMYQRMVTEGCPFAMGFGQTNRADRVLPFRPITNWAHPGWWNLLLGWFGNTRWHDRAMPVSPVSCLVTSDLLRRWMVQVRDFAAMNGFRDYYVMRRNIGGDLMIYLLATIDAKQGPLLAEEIVAQWSEHPDSMTVLAEHLDLFAGYWLARCWAVGYCVDTGELQKAARLAGYVVVSGLAAARDARRQGKSDLARSIASEIRCVVAKVGLARVAVQVIVAATAIALGKIGRSQKRPLEPLTDR
jgi:hypothetical protein